MSTGTCRQAVAVVVAGALGVVLAAVPGTAGAVVTTPDDAYTTSCPAPESLVSGTTWKSTRLAPGVVLQEGQHHDSKGRVRMHVIRADVTNTHLAFRPIMRKIAMRHPLSAMSRHLRHLVTVTNAGYFDYGTGAPVGPVVDKGRPVLSSSVPALVVGFAKNGLMQAGDLTLSGTVSSAGDRRPLTGLNVVRPASGLTGYTSRWGGTPVVVPNGAVSRYVKDGVVSSATHRFNKAPASGFLLVARGPDDVRWLRLLKRGAPVTVTRRVTTDAPRPFRLAYAVGTQIVLPGGQSRLGLSCRRSYKQPARTAIGFADGGRRLILTVVDDQHRSSLHGLDSIQMSQVMADLGADQAFMLDGGGSTEMLAKLPGVAGMSLRNHLSDGRERALPMGLAIFRR